MTPERWRDVRRLFDAARELEGEARVEFLGRACAESASLLADVERLFRAHAAAGSFIEEPLVRLVTQGSDGAEGAGEVRRIGPYAVERTLGQGGMGTVYEALRADEEYRRRVAIKVVRHGLDSDDWVRRFRSERQILADLDHPNIARLIEGGTLEDGRPYLVMEFVEGQPLDAACDQRRWSIRQRLELFVKVCGAVQFAHQSLIVHRDLKPGNILLSAAGEPKLLDFGIAKLLQPGDFPQTLALTEPGMRPMTLAYASPEQVAGGSLTTASDVYALGVVLYELLTGRSPYPSAGPDLPRAICEEAPPRPSAAAETHAGLPLAGGEDPTVTPESLAALRASDPRRLERTLAGDLDNIVLEALRKEPERRYPSAAALAADIERYLDHRPVLARPDTLTYRSRKFVRRHRGGVATAALAAVALIVFVSVLIAERNRSRYQETRANAVKDA
ncbi:MAG: serine/threonine-protein kinase, partial [Acidobacteriota bacterium]